MAAKARGEHSYCVVSVALLEPAGLLVSLLALAVYVRASPEQATRRRLIAASLLGTAALFFASLKLLDQTATKRKREQHAAP